MRQKKYKSKRKDKVKTIQIFLKNQAKLYWAPMFQGFISRITILGQNSCYVCHKPKLLMLKIFFETFMLNFEWNENSNSGGVWVDVSPTLW